MGEKVDKELCDERSGNIQRSLGNIETQVGQIWGRLNEESQAIAYKRGKCNAREMSTKKMIAIIGGLIVLVEAIMEIGKAIW